MTTTDQKSWKDGWEYRSLKMVFRIIAVVLFLGYLSFTGWMSWQWVQATYARSQDFSNITTVAENAIRSGELSDLTEWVSYRAPFDDSDKVIEALMPYVDKIGSNIFFLYRNFAFEKGDMEGALFWHQYTLYRMRYDSLRCGMVDGPEIIDDLLKTLQTQKVRDLFPKDTQGLKKVLQRVMDFDAQHPARNYPYDTCKMIQRLAKKGDFTVTDVSKWAIIRHHLRVSTEYAITQIDVPKE